MTDWDDDATYRATTLTELLPVEEPGRHRAPARSCTAPQRSRTRFDYQRAVWVLKPIAFILALVVVAGVFYVVSVPGPTSKPTAGEYLTPLGTVAPEPSVLPSPEVTPVPTPEVTWTPPKPTPARVVVRRTAPQLPGTLLTSQVSPMIGGTFPVSVVPAPTVVPDVVAPTPITTNRSRYRYRSGTSRPHRTPMPGAGPETVDEPPALIIIGPP